MAEILSVLGRAETWRIFLLSMRVSATALLIAFPLGAALGIALAIRTFRGRALMLVVVHGLLGTPSVGVGIALYLLLSQSGPLAGLDLLFTPAAMILAQALLMLPIVVALTFRFSQTHWRDYGETLVMDGASFLRRAWVIACIGRAGLAAAAVSAFGRAIAEVGAAMVVGGNIVGATRILTTAIFIDTSRGELASAMALGCLLVAASLTVALGLAAVRKLAADP